jgi:serine/threonine protein kinase
MYILFRDLKPENILVNKDENEKITLKIADFGISKASESQYLETLCGYIFLFYLFIYFIY